MQSFKKIVSDFTLKRLFWLVLGTAILSFGIHNIHQRAAITEGGVIGLVLLMNHWLGIPASIASPLLDFVCYALAFKFLGLDFILTAAVASKSLSPLTVQCTSMRPPSRMSASTSCTCCRAAARAALSSW